MRIVFADYFCMFKLCVQMSIKDFCVHKGTYRNVLYKQSFGRNAYINKSNNLEVTLAKSINED